MSSDKKNKKNTCDPKYYGNGVNNCGNGIRGFDKILKKLNKEEIKEDEN